MDDRRRSISAVCPPDPSTTSVFAGRLHFILKGVFLLDLDLLVFDLIR